MLPRLWTWNYVFIVNADDPLQPPQSIPSTFNSEEKNRFISKTHPPKENQSCFFSHHSLPISAQSVSQSEVIFIRHQMRNQAPKANEGKNVFQDDDDDD